MQRFLYWLRLLLSALVALQREWLRHKQPTSNTETQQPPSSPKP